MLSLKNSRNIFLISNQAITTFGNFIFLSISSIFLKLDDFYELAIFISIYIVLVVIIFQTFFYQLNFRYGSEASSFFVYRYRYLMIFLLVLLILGLIIGYIYQAILICSMIAIEIYRRNLTQLDNIKLSMSYGLFYQLSRLLLLIYIEPSSISELYKLLILTTLPFLVLIFFDLKKAVFNREKSSFTKDDLYISLTSGISTLQFYIPIFSSNLFFSKEVAAAIISVRFFANITNIFAELIEYGFKEFFKSLRSKINIYLSISVLIFAALSSLAIYIFTLLLLPIFFPKTEIFSQTINFPVIAVIFWIGQILHITQRIISYSFNHDGNFKITFISTIISFIVTLIYFIVLILNYGSELFYVWAISYILIPTSTILFIILINRRNSHENINNY